MVRHQSPFPNGAWGQTPAGLPGGTRPPAVPGYEILREVGRGGMGVVYQARQVALNRVVALKLLPSGVATDPDLLARFRGEAEMVARLAHPNIIQVYEVGACEDGPFFAMEFADGGSLAKAWNDTPQEPRRSAELLATVAEAVHAAHERGVLHRDLKPSNILLSACPGRGNVPKVSDFGLAHRLGENQRLTLTGQALGTPGYMSPEQARGGGLMSPAVDVYALGVLLYEALTGGPPFRGATPIESIHLMLTNAPTPPSRLRPGIPRDLETICLRCLETDPRRRYAGADRLADDLRRFLDNRPIAARPVSPGERAWKWARRQPGTAALLGAIVLLLCVTFSLVTLLWQRAEERRAQFERTARGEAEARREAQEYATRLLIERAVGLCEAGNYGAGLLWFCRALETAPADAIGLRESIRALIGGWSTAIHPVRHAFAAPDEVRFAAFAGQGDHVVTAGKESVRCWDIATGQPVGTPARPSGKIRSVAVSPDGSTVLVAADGVVRRWDVRSGTGVGPPLGHPETVGAVCFSKATGLFATSAGSRVYLWASNGDLPRFELPLAGLVTRFAFSTDDSLLAAADRTGAVRIWDTATGEVRSVVMGHEGEVLALAFSPDGRLLLTGSGDRTARLWETSTGAPVRTFREHSAPVRVVAFTADGRAVFTASEDHRGFLWNVDGVTPRLRFQHEHAVTVVAFSHDRRFLATAGDDHTARVWDLSTGDPVGEPLRHQESIHTVAFHPGGRSLLTAGNDGSARVWDLRLPANRDLDLGQPIHSVDVTPDGRELLISTVKDSLHHWEIATARFRRSASIPSLFKARVSPTGRHFAVTLWSGAAQVMDLETGAPAGPALLHPAPVLTAVFSPDGQYLLTGSDDKDRAARVWDWRTGALIQSFTGHGRKVPAAAFRPDGLSIATGSWDRSARLWDVRTGSSMLPPLKQQDLIQTVCFSPDGAHVLTAGDDYTAVIWDVNTGRQVGLPLRHPGKVQVAAFSPDGRLIVTGSKDRTARLWNVATGKPLAPPFPHGHEVHSVVFSPDGRTVFTGCWDGAVRGWPVPPSAPDNVPGLRHWLLVNAGLELDGNGSLVTVTASDWQHRNGSVREARD